jgi:hypothetical protein
LKVVAGAARHDPAGLAAWFQSTTDCGIKAQLVDALQQASPTEPLLDLAQVALSCDGQNPTAQKAVANAHYRLAATAWNELANHPPPDAAARAREVQKVKELLSKAEGSERAPELLRKVEDYEGAVHANRQREIELREQDKKRQCLEMHERARWTHGESRVAIADLGEIVRRMKSKSAGCADYLEPMARQELAEWQTALSERLIKECDAEYYRLPDLPATPTGLTPDQLEGLRAQIRGFHEACEPFIAASTFRAQKVQTLLERLEAAPAEH